MNKLFFANLLPGTILYDRFRLIRCINASQKGGVYLCEALNDLSERFALKIFRNVKGTILSGRDGLIREFRLAQIASHPNILASCHLFEDEEFVSFTMPFLPGGSLADYIERKKVWKAREILSVLHQISLGLSALHKAGVLHRDLKPENILFDEDSCVKIADFGIGTTTNSELGDGHYLIGTPQYWPPEYLESGVFDERADVYAVGIIGYELLTGELPPSSELRIEDLTVKISQLCLDVRELPAHYSLPLRRIVIRCLQKDPRKRFQSALELRDTIAVVKGWEDSASEKIDAAGYYKGHSLNMIAETERRRQSASTIKVAKHYLKRIKEQNTPEKIALRA